MAVRYNPKTGRMESYDEEDDTIDTSTTDSESSDGTSGYDGRLRWNPETNRLESVYADDDPNDPYYKQAQEEQKRVKSAEIMKPVRDQEADMSKYGLKAIQTGTPVDQLKEEDRRRNEGSIFEKLYQGALDIANDLRENTTSYNYADEVAKYREGETKEEYDARQLQYQNDSVWVDKDLQQIRKSISEKEQQIKTNAELYGNPLTPIPITDPKYKEATTFENQIHTQKEVEQLKEMESIYMQYLGQMETKRDILAAIQREFSIGQREEKLPLIGGLISIGDTLKTKDILEKESKGEDLTDEELIYARNAKSKMVEQRLNYGYGETIGSIVANAPTFALEFMLTAGLAGVGKRVATKVVGEVAEQGVKQGIKLSAKRVAQNLVTNIFGEVTRLPAFMGRISNDAALYTTPKYDVVLGEDGDSLLKKLDEGDDWATAIAKATGSQLFENISESAVGNFVEDIVGLSKKALLGKFLQKVEDNPLKYGLDAGTKVTKDVADKVLDTMGWNGIAAEVLEEEFAEPFQAGIEGREYKDPLSSEEGRTRLFLEAIGIGFLGTIYQVPNFVLSKNIDARKKYESQAGPEIIDVPEHETIVNDPQIIKQVEEAMNPDNAAEPINTQISEDSNIKDGVVESSSKASNATLEKITQSKDAPDVKVSQLEQLISDIDSGKYNDDVAQTTKKMAEMELGGLKNKLDTQQATDNKSPDSQLIEEAKKYKTAKEFYLRMSDSTRDSLRNKGIRGEEAIADYWNTQVKDSIEPQKIDDLNPTGGLLVDYDPQSRMTMALGENITTLDKTMGVKPDEMITIYRGAPKKQKTINPGDFVTTNYDLAKSYTGDDNVLSLEVRAADVLDDIREPLGEEYIYRPSKETTEDSLIEEAKKFKTAEEFVKSELSKDNLVTVYRGSKTGKVHSDIKDFTFFATNPEYAKQYMTKGEKLVEYKLPESSLIRDKINDQEVQYLVDSRNPRIKQFIDIWNKANTRQVEDGTLTLYNGSDGKVSEVQKSYKNILVSETNQSELLQQLADDGDAKAKELLQGRINFVEADKYLRDKYKGEIDAIQYNNSDRPMLGKEYHDMKDGKFYAEDREHAKIYSLQSRGEKYKNENKQDNISNNLQNDKTTEKTEGDKEEKKFFAKGDIFNRAENEIESLKEELDPESYEALSYAVEESKRIREESALEIINELEGAMAGFRYAVRDEDSMDLEYKGQKSTFPDWFSLRTRVEIDDFIAKMPENPSEWTLENNPFREGTKKYDSWVEMVNKLDNVSIREVLEGDRDMIEDAIGMTIEQLDNKVSSILGDKTPAKKLSTKESPVSQGLNKLKESKAYTRIEEDLPEEIKAKDKPYYEVMNLAENNARALEIIDNDYNRAKRIALGHEATPEGVTQVAIATAVAAKAEMDGDYALMSRVASRISLIGTRMGQEIVSFRARLDKTQASDFIQEVIDRKIDSKYKKARKIIFKTEEDIEQNTPRKQAVKEIDREKKEAKKFLDVKQIKIKSAQEIIDLLTCEL